MDDSELSAEVKLILSEIQSLEQENSELVGRLETESHAREVAVQENRLLQKQFDKARQTMSDIMAQQNDLISQKQFLEAESQDLAQACQRVSNKYDDNMQDLEDLMKDIEFLKGEIDTLQSKAQILEAEIPYKYKDSENLEKRVKVTFFRALNNLQKRISDVQRKAEVIYYQKGEI